MEKPSFCHSATVGRDDMVELHGAEAAPAGAVERVQAHGAGDAAAARFGRGDVAAIGDMGAAAALVGLQIIGAHDAAADLGREHFVAGHEPETGDAGRVQIAVDGVGLAGSQYRRDDGEDRRAIGVGGGADHEGHSSSGGTRTWPGGGISGTWG